MDRPVKIVIACGLLFGCAPRPPPAKPPVAATARPAPVAVASPPAHADAGPADAGSAGSTDSATSTATPKSAHLLELLWNSAWNLHYAGNRGAEHLNEHGAVTIDLGASGRCTAVDVGTRDRSLLDGNRYTDKTTKWRAVWRGTYAVDKHKLHVELAQEHAVCLLTTSERDGATQYEPTKSSCTAGIDRLVLDCEKQSVDAAPSSDAPKTQPTPVWSCSAPAGKAPAIGTSFPWVFGTEQCLERTGGAPRSGPLRYAHCKAPAGRTW